MKNHFWVLCLFVAGLSSCELDNGISDKYEVGVREDIVLGMNQVLSPGGSGLEFVFSTTTAEHCEGSGFEHETARDQDKFTIHLINLQKPDSCLGTNANAIQHVPAPSLKGTYDLSIDLGQLIHNSGRLIISEESFRLDLNSRFGLQIPHLEMKRVPLRTIWGYIYHPQLQIEANSIMTERLAELASPFLTEPGFYGHFEIQKSGALILHTDENISGAKTFIATFNSDVHTLSELADDIRLSLPPGSEFRLFAWEGSRF